MARLSFGDGFKFGFSTVGVQHEMGVSGSEFESDWSIWLRDAENILGGVVSGDQPEQGPGYWGLYQLDHSNARSIGMDAAWITVEWARIFPSPTTGIEVPVEQGGRGPTRLLIEEKHVKRLENVARMDALRRYREIISDWRSRGGFVIVNLFHWALPTWLHDPIAVRKRGPDRAPAGWLEDRCPIEFAKFAGFVAYHLDDLVDAWYTMNEPMVVAQAGYLQPRSGFPPGYLDIPSYEVARRNLAIAHALAYDAVKNFSKKPIGLVESVAHWMPHREEDAQAAEAGFEHNIYPYNAAARGLISGETQDELKGRLDWIGLNYYTRIVVRVDDGAPLGFRILDGYGYGCTPRGHSRDGRPVSDFGWEVYPEGLYEVLKRLYSRYRLPIYVTENGVADAEDRLRPRFIVSHLYQLHRARGEGVDVRGYFHWNLTDNLEWARGYSMRFGLFELDLETKKRFVRPSALVFREIATSKSIPEEFESMAAPPAGRGLEG